MADTEKTTPEGQTSEEILNEIIGSDGTFQKDFNALFKKYLGEGESPAPIRAKEPAADAGASPAAAEAAGPANAAAARQTASRSPSAPPAQTVPPAGGYPQEPYGYPQYMYPPMGYGFMPYYGMPMPYMPMYGDPAAWQPPEAPGGEGEESKPTFVPGGVLYPQTGVGESMQRVVFDADWEARARQEAARREQQRRENLLRGDSAYARAYRYGGVDSGVQQSRVPVNPAFIDPLTEKKERPRPENRFDFQDPDDLEGTPWEERMTLEDELRYEQNGKRADDKRNRTGKRKKRR